MMLYYTHTIDNHRRPWFWGRIHSTIFLFFVPLLIHYFYVFLFFCWTSPYHHRSGWFVNACAARITEDDGDLSSWVDLMLFFFGGGGFSPLEATVWRRQTTADCSHASCTSSPTTSARRCTKAREDATVSHVGGIKEGTSSPEYASRLGKLGCAQKAPNSIRGCITSANGRQ